MQTLKETWAAFKSKPLTVRDQIITECGKSVSWFYTVLENPKSLSPAEKAVFEKHLGEEINWPALNLLAE